MSVLGQLATSLNRRDEVPNQKLAKRVAARSDKKAVKELVENLANSDKNIQSDCIKVLYEIGERKPSLIAEYGNEFVRLLASKDNRLVWGAMTALDTITLENPKAIYSSISKVLRAAEEGSVITRDHLVSILTKLASTRKYSESAFPLLLEQLKSSPENQLPMYAEKTVPVINDMNRTIFIKALTSRLNGFASETKRRRVEKVIRKVSSATEERSPKVAWLGSKVD